MNREETLEIINKLLDWEIFEATEDVRKRIYPQPYKTLQELKDAKKYLNENLK